MWPKQLSSLKVLDLSGNQQMCGQLQDVPDGWTLRKTATGLGSQCKSQRGVSANTAIIAGAVYSRWLCDGYMCCLWCAGWDVWLLRPGVLCLLI